MNKTFFAAISAGVLSLSFAHAACAQAVAAKPAVGAEKAGDTQIEAAFAAWDLDRNGVLSRTEFRSGWMALRRAEALQARLRTQFHAVDANKNNAIDASEYGSLLLVKRAGSAAPPLSAFDSNKNQRLEFGEYLELVQRLAATTPVAAAPTPRK